MKSKTLKIWMIRLGLLALPLIVSAVTAEDVVNRLKSFITLIIGLLFAVATLYFVWGVIQYIGAGGDEGKIKTGREHMIWGIIGMVIMLAVWGIVTAIVNYFSLEQRTPLPPY